LPVSQQLSSGDRVFVLWADGFLLLSAGFLLDIAHNIGIVFHNIEHFLLCNIFWMHATSNLGQLVPLQLHLHI
jgi:hypothetical protein